MTGRHEVSIQNYSQAQQTARDTEVGAYFVFTRQAPVSGLARLGRLLAKPPRSRSVLPLVEAPVSLPGLTIAPVERGLRPIAAVVADRDLYRAEQDTAHLFVAVPGKAPPELTLILE